VVFTQETGRLANDSQDGPERGFVDRTSRCHVGLIAPGVSDRRALRLASRAALQAACLSLLDEFQIE
jgi:hypothetical protein